MKIHGHRPPTKLHFHTSFNLQHYVVSDKMKKNCIVTQSPNKPH